MQVAGIDGCRAGWFMIRWTGESYDYGLYRDFSSINNLSGAELILVDIPIGLSSPGFPRKLEDKLRKELKGRSSTVFNPPSRAALYADDIDSAKRINLKEEGKSFSIQTWNIIPKIREVDRFLKNQSLPIYESHPELCFKYLNQGIILQSSKKTDQGYKQRYDLLAAYDPEIINLISKAEVNTLRSQVQKDDIIDAACLALTAKLGIKNKLSFLEDAENESGQTMKIAYYKP